LTAGPSTQFTRPRRLLTRQQRSHSVGAPRLCRKYLIRYEVFHVRWSGRLRELLTGSACEIGQPLLEGQEYFQPVVSRDRAGIPVLPISHLHLRQRAVWKTRVWFLARRPRRPVYGTPPVHGWLQNSAKAGRGPYCLRCPRHLVTEFCCRGSFSNGTSAQFNRAERLRRIGGRAAQRKL
jgi:hypothetical protein